ncbi:sigma-70 family RNA polymerase sigma factor [Fibrella sp. HMF5335]|uniref:Sigma-70 family RNA polymerase sigma factor n=1 Tax=Fibrella rubiginis TaxID=2817060 RepID=A0A939GN00_9BACT|nr:sigma-70 family RNA polymerase sigma factor [Fibrella rubiginis]MBO0939795.1 sigma-70 family RNA polymerase sigma factor [Fibrella rubiginis]
MSNHLIRFTDAELWNAFREGDDEAFAYMYRKFAPILYSYGFHLCRDHDVVEDCIQDQFIHLQQHRAKLGVTDSIKFYLYRSIRRRIAEKAQANARWVHEDESAQRRGEWADAGGRPEFEIDMPAEAQLIDAQTQAEHKQKIDHLLNRLPRRQKEALYLMYYEKLNYPEVAQVMDLEIKSVYNLIYSALVSLRNYIKESDIRFYTWPLIGWLLNSIV